MTNKINTRAGVWRRRIIIQIKLVHSLGKNKQIMKQNEIEHILGLMTSADALLSFPGFPTTELSYRHPVHKWKSGLYTSYSLTEHT